MKYEIWHDQDPRFGFGERPEFPAAYTKVAVVESDDLDDVFRITNHIDHDWTTNPEVQWHQPGGCRSTSVGDIVVDENGTAYYCANAGWDKLDDEADQTEAAIANAMEDF